MGKFNLEVSGNWFAGHLRQFKKFPPKLHLQSLEDVCFRVARSNMFYVELTSPKMSFQQVLQYFLYLIFLMGQISFTAMAC